MLEIDSRRLQVDGDRLGRHALERERLGREPDRIPHVHRDVGRSRVEDVEVRGRQRGLHARSAHQAQILELLVPGDRRFELQLRGRCVRRALGRQPQRSGQRSLRQLADLTRWQEPVRRRQRQIPVECRVERDLLGREVAVDLQPPQITREVDVPNPVAAVPRVHDDGERLLRGELPLLHLDP